MNREEMLAWRRQTLSESIAKAFALGLQEFRPSPGNLGHTYRPGSLFHRAYVEGQKLGTLLDTALEVK